MTPDYQAVMLPLLKLCSDGTVHNVKQAIDKLAHEFGLTVEERTKLLPSGNQQVFNNRVGWALAYLKKAGLLESRGRALFAITPAGKQLLQKKPEVVNRKILLQYDSFAEFALGSDAKSDSTPPSQETKADLLIDKATPEARIFVAHEELDSKLLDDLQVRLQTISWQRFEFLVLELLVAMGYGGLGSAKHSGGTGDQGVDGLINEDALGLDKNYVQAKKWQAAVGSPEMQGFVGALAAKNARKGVFFTTSKFTSDARKFVFGIGAYSIALVDGIDIAKLMLKHRIGVQASSTVIISRIDGDFFNDGDD